MEVRPLLLLLHSTCREIGSPGPLTGIGDMTERSISQNGKGRLGRPFSIIRNYYHILWFIITKPKPAANDENRFPNLG